jgi:hypothetical protein
MTEWTGRPRDGFPRYAPRDDELYPLTRAAEQHAGVRYDRDRLKPYVFTAAALLLIAGAIGLATVIWIDNPTAAADKAPVPAAATATAVPQRKPVEKAPPVATSIHRDGVYLVGREIKVGTYRTVSGPDCFWARLRDTSREDGSVITSRHLVSGQQYVTIAKGDRAFETRGCNSWVMVP